MLIVSKQAHQQTSREAGSDSFIRSETTRPSQTIMTTHSLHMLGTGSKSWTIVVPLVPAGLNKDAEVRVC